jgi:hypothetical protein
MVDIKALTEKDIGKWVTYEPGHKKESGRIKSWNGTWVFVVYNCDGYWHRYDEFTAAATNPRDLKIKGG